MKTILLNFGVIQLLGSKKYFGLLKLYKLGSHQCKTNVIMGYKGRLPLIKHHYHPTIPLSSLIHLLIILPCHSPSSLHHPTPPPPSSPFHPPIIFPPSPYHSFIISHHPHLSLPIAQSHHPFIILTQSSPITLFHRSTPNLLTTQTFTSIPPSYLSHHIFIYPHTNPLIPPLHTDHTQTLYSQHTPINADDLI